MRQKLMVAVVLAAAILGGGAGSVMAGFGPGGELGCGPPDMKMETGGLEARMAKVLKLTESQQSQIKTILDSEREQVKEFFDKMHENRKLLMQAAEATVFDEAAVRSLAVAQAAVEIELTVSRTKVQSQINALLTAEQRELFQLLRPDIERLPPKGGE